MNRITISFPVKYCLFVGCLSAPLLSSECSHNKLRNDAACNCFVAETTGLIPSQMRKLCIEDFGTDLLALKPYCKPYLNLSANELDLKGYLKNLVHTIDDCFNAKVPGSLDAKSRQYLETPPHPPLTSNLEVDVKRIPYDPYPNIKFNTGSTSDARIGNIDM